MMSKYFFALLALFYTLSFAAPSAAFAFDATPSCLRHLEGHFFEVVALDQALNLYQVGQSSWNLIKSELSRKSREVAELAYREGKRSRPNPFDYPFDPKGAEKILLRVLYEVFRGTLRDYDVTNESSIRGMFSYVAAARRQELDRCLLVRR